MSERKIGDSLGPDFTPEQAKRETVARLREAVVSLRSAQWCLINSGMGCLSDAEVPRVDHYVGRLTICSNGIGNLRREVEFCLSVVDPDSQAWMTEMTHPESLCVEPASDPAEGKA